MNGSTAPRPRFDAHRVGLLWCGTKAGARVDDNGDRRMPSTNEVQTSDTTAADAASTYFDAHPDEYQVLWDWVTQGAAP
jgi:hypothetical protein